MSELDAAHTNVWMDELVALRIDQTKYHQNLTEIAQQHVTVLFQNIGEFGAKTGDFGHQYIGTAGALLDRFLPAERASGGKFGRQAVKVLAASVDNRTKCVIVSAQTVSNGESEMFRVNFRLLVRPGL